jgi:hypothetical protein
MAFTLNSHNPTPGAAIPSSWGDAINANMVSLNDFFSMPLFPNSSGMPLTNGNTSGYAIAASSGGGTPSVNFPVLTHDGTATAIIGREWAFKMPRNYGGSLVIAGEYYMGSANQGTAVFGVRLAAFRAAGTATTPVYSTEILGTVAVPAAANVIQAFTVTIPFAASNSLVAGDHVNLSFYRKPADTADGGTVGLLNVTDLALYFNLAGY